MTVTTRRRRLAATPPPTPKATFDGEVYAHVMSYLGLDHKGMAKALGVTKWCSIAWKSGRRRVTPLAQTAIRGLMLQSYAGEGSVQAINQQIERMKRG